MLPKVTGIKLLMKNCAQVTSAPKKIPNGMKNMFATLCSNPIHTNAMIGNQIPKNLPTTSSAALAKYTAKHTNQLQPIPLRKHCTQVKEAVDFPAAIKVAPPKALVLAMVIAPPANASGTIIPVA